MLAAAMGMNSELLQWWGRMPASTAGRFHTLTWTSNMFVTEQAEPLPGEPWGLMSHLPAPGLFWNLGPQ